MDILDHISWYIQPNACTATNSRHLPRIYHSAQLLSSTCVIRLLPVLRIEMGTQSVVGNTSPTDANLVKNILEAAKRRLAHPCIKKEPMTPELLKTYYDSLSKPINLKDLRTRCMFIIGFAGFLRSAEVLNLKSHDILFHDTHVSLFIKNLKQIFIGKGHGLFFQKHLLTFVQ